MKHIMLNLKRFDVERQWGGVNDLAPVSRWAKEIVTAIEGKLRGYEGRGDFAVFFPEAHILSAAAARGENSPVAIGCQGVHRVNVAKGGNFGALTTSLPAAAAKSLGCSAVLIGHCEERRDKAGILAEGGVTDPDAVGRILNAEIRCAQESGLKVLFCIGETAEEQPRWQEVLGRQLSVGLAGVDRAGVVIGYEPVWAIGPGKTPPDRETIQKIARFVKAETGGMEIVYGGGLKLDNAKMLASIPEIDGGLIALTRFGADFGFYPGEYLDIIEAYLAE